MKMHYDNQLDTPEAVKTQLPQIILTCPNKLSEK